MGSHTKTGRALKEKKYASYYLHLREIFSAATPVVSLLTAELAVIVLFSNTVDAVTVYGLKQIFMDSDGCQSMLRANLDRDLDQR